MGWADVEGATDPEVLRGVRRELRRMLLLSWSTYVFAPPIGGALFVALFRPYVPAGRLAVWCLPVGLAALVVLLAVVPPLVRVDDRHGAPVLLATGAWITGAAFGTLPWFVGLQDQPVAICWLCFLCLLGISVGALTGTMSTTLHGLRVQIALWGTAIPCFALAGQWLLVAPQVILLWFILRDGLATRRLIVAGLVARIEADRAAVRDPLTGLANRAGALAALDALTGARDGPGVAVLYVDLDHFKSVNDTHGHLVGDALLRQAAHRLRACCRAGDVVARLGGDEFLVVLPGRAVGEAARLAERIVTDLERPFDVDGLELRVSASIGVAAAAGGAGGGTDDLVHRADEALYAAKAAGRGRASADGAVRPAGDAAPR